MNEPENEYTSNASRVSFRNKSTGWKDYLIAIDFGNNKNYKKPHSQDDFILLFLNNICLRPSCYDCKFKDMNRPSDITLGDAWGVQNHSPEMYDDRGTSVVLLHTDKGKEFFEKKG